MSSQHTYAHPQLGFSIELPPSLEPLDDVPLAALVAAERDVPDGAFRANLVVTVEELESEAGVEQYAQASVAALSCALDGFRVIDSEPIALGDRRAIRLLAHHDAAGHAVAFEQWQLVVGARGYTLTASCCALEYDDLADAFAASAATFAP